MKICPGFFYFCGLGTNGLNALTLAGEVKVRQCYRVGHVGQLGEVLCGLQGLVHLGQPGVLPGPQGVEVHHEDDGQGVGVRVQVQKDLERKNSCNSRIKSH